MLVKVDLCQKCATKLRALRDEKGEEAMARELGAILEACPVCCEQVLPYQPPGTRLVTQLKKRN